MKEWRLSVAPGLMHLLKEYQISKREAAQHAAGTVIEVEIKETP